MVGVDGPGDKLFRFIFNTPGNPNTVQLQQPPMSPISASHGLAMGSLGHARGRGMSNSLSVPSFASDTNKSGTGTVTAMTNSYFYNDYSRSMSLSDSNLNATASLNNSRGTLNDEVYHIYKYVCVHISVSGGGGRLSFFPFHLKNVPF